MADPVAVVVTDEQSGCAIDRNHFEALARHVLDDSDVHDAAELNVLFVDEDEMARLNRRFMGESGPTDVLAFPLDDPAGPAANGPRLLGDVVVCPVVAERHASDHQRTLDDELRLLVVHGILHILGMDHVDADEAGRMQAREQELLDDWAQYRR